MTDTKPTEDPLGTVGACVMSMYGISRSLECRDLGPAQLLPAIEDFGQHAEQAWDAARSIARELSEKASAQGSALPIEELAHQVDVVTSRVDELFEVAGRLTAKQRLELERSIERVGGDLQALHRLLGIASAALSRRPIELSLSDLVRGRWGSKPAFVTRRIELCVRMADGTRFEADPRLAWAVVEHYLKELPEQMNTVFGCMEWRSIHGGRRSREVLRVGDIGDSLRSSLLRRTVDLGPFLDLEQAVLAEIMSDEGWATSTEEDEVRIAFAAA